MNTSEISILIEPAYLPTPWWEETRAGIDSELQRRGIKAKYHFCESIKSIDLNKNCELIIAGETLAWIDNILYQCECSDIRAVLACSELDRTAPKISCITLNRREAMSEAVRYLYSCGRRHIGVFAINPDSPADLSKLEGFRNTVNCYGNSPDEKLIIKYSGNIEDCFSLLCKKIDYFDAIICTNDLSARYLITRLFECGAGVPEDIFVMSFGNTLTGRFTTPSITTVTLDLQELGRKAVETSIFLSRNPGISSINITISCQIIARQSTDNILPDIRVEVPINNARHTEKFLSSYSDPILNQLSRLERYLASCDAVDAKIIKGLIDNITYPLLAEMLFIADGTLRYRIERLFRELKVSSRKELSALFKRFMPNFSPDMISGEKLYKARR